MGHSIERASKEKSPAGLLVPAPALLARWFFGTDKQLKMTAKVLGAEVVGSLYTGMIAKQQYPKLADVIRAKIKPLTERRCEQFTGAPQLTPYDSLRN